MGEEIDDAWRALCDSLEQHGRAMQEEVRTYPTPIARCDVQLSKVLEQRAAIFAALRRANDLERLRTGFARRDWLRRLRAFADGLQGIDDDCFAAARERMLATLPD